MLGFHHYLPPKFVMVRSIVVACLFLFSFCLSADAQIIGGGGGASDDPVQIFATNNAGFIQNGPMGPDNLILFEITPVYPEEGEEPAPPVPAQFSIVGNLGAGVDADGNGFEDSIGHFSGLEWSTGTPGAGTLIGCVLNDDEIGGSGNGEFYQIDPSTGDTKLIGAAPQGLVVTIVPNGTGYVPAPLPFGTPLIGGSGSGLVAAFNLEDLGNGIQAPIDLVVLGPGQGYEIGDVVRMPGAGQQDATFVVTALDGSQFDDLAYNPINNRMYGIRNVVANGVGTNQLWIDSDGDNIPDSFAGIILVADSFNAKEDPPIEPLATFAGGIYFDENGLFYLYDAMTESIFRTQVPGGDPFGVAAYDEEAGQESSELSVGNGLTVVDGRVFVATDTPQRSSIVSFYDAPEDPLMPPDPAPIVIPAVVFPQTFFDAQSGAVLADVTVGDMVPAEADLGELPPIFPDNVVINNGNPGKNSVLEAVVVSDDFRYCVSGIAPTPKQAPVDVSFVFTIPNPTNVTLLGIDIESQGNVMNLEHSILVFNVNTQQFDDLGSGSIENANDTTLTVDLSTVISDYVDSSNGTLTCRVQTRSTGPVLFFPWSAKFDSVIARAE